MSQQAYQIFGDVAGSESIFGCVILLRYIFTNSNLKLIEQSLVVHGFLKRGVYKPVRTKYSKMAAAASTFLASGLFHEWLLSVMLYQDHDSHGDCTPPSCFRPGYGRNTLFFVWNAMLIGLEYAIGSAAIFQMLKANLPTTVLSLLIASTGLPVAHWFTNDYVRTDFFNDGQIGWPMIIRLDDQEN